MERSSFLEIGLGICAVVLGATFRGTCVSLAGTGTTNSAGATISVFVAPAQIDFIKYFFCKGDIEGFGFRLLSNVYGLSSVFKTGAAGF